MLYNEECMYRLALFEKGGDENLQFFLVLFFFLVPLTEWLLLNLRNRTRSFLDA